MGDLRLHDLNELVHNLSDMFFEGRTLLDGVDESDNLYVEF